MTVPLHETNQPEPLTNCPSCGGEELASFFAVPDVPVHSVLNIRSLEEAREFPRGQIDLALCRDCGLIANRLFDPQLLTYHGEYEATQAYSPTFSAFARELAQRLIDRHGLRGKRVMEIGCGMGEFLHLICEMGENEGVGVDPAYAPGRVSSSADERIRFIRDYYDPSHGDGDADLIICRMTLEHIPHPGAFLKTLREGIGDRRPQVFFQVPNAARVLEQLAFEDVYYEHCNYFSAGSLARLFRRTGFDVQSLDVDYDDQYLMIEAVPTDQATGKQLPREDDLAALGVLSAYFPKAVQSLIGKWRKRLAETRLKRNHIFLWGGGSKAVAFLSALELDGAVDGAIDINPHRQGCYLPGSGKPVVAPAYLRHAEPGLIVVMNRIYLDEVRQELAEMDLSPEVVAL